MGMNKTQEALKLALEALEKIGLRDWVERKEKAITAIREALAEQPAQQQGWKLVPVEPTADMRNAYHSVTDDDVTMKGAAGSRWFAMLNAAPQPAQQQEPVAWYDEEYDCAYTSAELDGGNVDGLLPLYIRPQAREPLTDEQFLELLLRTGTQELVGWATFVGGSIQMQGKIGLLRGAKLLKEFVESAHGIGEKK